MALIVDGICRFTLHHLLDGSLPADVVLDYEITVTPGSPSGRALAIQTQAKLILDQWVTNGLPRMGSDIQFVSVSWVDLDSATGSTGSVSSSTTNTLPKPGTVAATSVPAQVCTLVQKQIIASRNHRNGRIFFPGTPSTDIATSGNGPVASYMLSLNTSMTAFFSNTTVSYGSSPAVTNALAVVHEKDSSFSLVTGMATQLLFGTQRRRLRP